MRKIVCINNYENDLHTRHAITFHEIDIFHNANSHRVTYPV